MSFNFKGWFSFGLGKSGVFIMPRFQGPSEPFPHFIRRQNSHCILHADRDLAGLIEEWKSLQARAKPSRSQTAAHAVNEWADPGCEIVREHGCLTEWMKMIQLETEAKSKDIVRKWESSNLKVANNCQNVRVTKSRALGRELHMKVHACTVNIIPSFRRGTQGDWYNQGPPGLHSQTLVREKGRGREGGRELERDDWQLEKLKGPYKKGRESLRTLLEENKGREAKNSCFWENLF